MKRMAASAPDAVPTAARGLRRIFVGDIHGCLRPLDALLRAVSFVPGLDLLYPVGDLVNKGPDSLGVLRRLREVEALPVIGNHDLQWLAEGRIPDPALSGWLRSLPVVRMLGDVVVVHGGLHPKWNEGDLQRLAAADAQHRFRADADYAVNVRYCDDEGRRPEEDWPPPPPPFRPWDDFYRGRARVVFGHWARRGLSVGERAIGLDSGCCYGGRLSAWIAEEDRIVQVSGETGAEGPGGGD